MEVRLQKWGNSMGIRIPSTIVKDYKLKENDVIKLEEEDNKVIMTFTNGPKIDLEERFKNYKGPILAKEFSWDDKPVGREIW